MSEIEAAVKTKDKLVVEARKVRLFSGIDFAHAPWWADGKDKP